MAVLLFILSLIDIPIWSYHSFQLEHLGKDVFLKIHYINQAWFCLNCVSLAVILRYHKLRVTAEKGD